MPAPEPAFRVTWMPKCGQAAAALSAAVGPPLSQRLRDILREADERLRESAREWGDPYSDLKGMRVTLFTKRYVRDGLAIRYAVHVERNDVFVQLVEPIRGGPFDVG